jgi:hypothetical protein
VILTLVLLQWMLYVDSCVLVCLCMLTLIAHVEIRVGGGGYVLMVCVFLVNQNFPCQLQSGSYTHVSSLCILG